MTQPLKVSPDMPLSENEASGVAQVYELGLMTLAATRPGDRVIIRAISDPQAAMMAVRLGIAVGETVTLAAVVPGGPYVLRHGGMEIALGREICQQITVSRASKSTPGKSTAFAWISTLKRRFL